MNLTRALIVVCGALALLSESGSGQESRYEVGLKMRSFEKAWEAHPEVAAKKRAVGEVELAVQSFFGGRLGEVARRVNLARYRLQGIDPSPATIFADSLAWRLDRRVVDPKAAGATAKALRLFETPAPAAGEMKFRLTWRSADQKSFAAGVVAAERDPLEIELAVATESGTPRPMAEGDYVLETRIDGQADAEPIAEQGVSFIENFGARRAALAERIEKLAPQSRPEGGAAVPSSAPTSDDPARATEIATLVQLADILKKAAEGKAIETDMPFARLLSEAEGLATAIEKNARYYDRKKTGRFWMALAAGGRSPLSACIGIPPLKDEAAAKTPMPIVIAMHGAGGSENLFFDGYGAGKIVDLAYARGWIVVTPRSGFFGSSASVAGIVDAMAAIYPIDRSHIYVIGHSMGSGQAATMVAKDIDKVRACALISAGGGRSDALKELPVFVGTAERDFSRRSSEGLAKTLGHPESKNCVLEVAPAAEHLTVVADLLPKIFAFFDAQK